MRKITSRESARRGCAYCTEAIIEGQTKVTCTHNKCLFHELDGTSWARVEKMERNSYDPFGRYMNEPK